MDYAISQVIAGTEAKTASRKSSHPWWDSIQEQRILLRGRAYITIKRVLDLALGTAALICFLPLIPLIALLIKLDSPDGPVFFVQNRMGRGGKRFRMYKFRTMRPDAEEIKRQLVAVNEDGELSGPLKLENDPRVTRVGRILRKTSLDELPQLFNVLKGDMGLVGPRPTSFGLASYNLWHTERLDVRPGITGLWQVCDRGSVDFDNWARWDIRYVCRQCLWLDLQILYRTFLVVFDKQGAH